MNNDKTNSSNIIQKNKKHENASFVRPKKLTKIEALSKKEKMELLKKKKELEKEIENKIDEIENSKYQINKPNISNPTSNPLISKEEIKKIKTENNGKLLSVLNERDLKYKKDLDKTTVIPTISLDDYSKENKTKTESIFKRISNYFKALKEKKKQKKLEQEQHRQKKLELKSQKIIDKNKKVEKAVKKEKKKTNDSLIPPINVNEKKLVLNTEKELEKAKKLELKKQEQLKRQEEKKKIIEQKEQRRKEEEEKRKEKLKIKVEEQAKRQKEKEDKIILIQKEKQEKFNKIKKEKEEAKKQRKEKLKLIRKAQEESKEKEKNERKSLQEKIVAWYNNLAFVRDAKNRRELQRQTLLIDFEGSDAVRSEEKIMYKYVAKNNETGKVETGYFAAFSKLDVHSFLIAEGYEVYEITPQKDFARSFNIITPKFKSTELDFFLTQLSTFLKSGITLIDSVKILSKQSKKKTQKNVYKSIIYELSMGENFSEALAKQGTIFPRLLINMIKTSELTGDLPETLDDMANYYREIEKTKKQMISAITYPAVVLVFAFAILIFIMVSVIPQFIGIYKDLGTDLPKITIIIINLSSFLKSNWIYVVIGVIAFIIVFIILFKSIKVFKTVVQSIIMNLPIFGKIVIYNEVTMFTKTFASLLNHNVYITDCMEVLSKITNNEIYKMLIFDTITNLAKGEAISNSFKNHWAFPTIAYEMILTGEKTGQLGNMMDKVAVYYQDLHKNAVNQIKAFIEPVMIVILAAIVGTVLLSVILPMFDMYTNIG